MTGLILFISLSGCVRPWQNEADLKRATAAKLDLAVSDIDIVSSKVATNLTLATAGYTGEDTGSKWTAKTRRGIYECDADINLFNISCTKQKQ